MKILANLHLFVLHRGHQSPARSGRCGWDSEIFSFSVFKLLDCSPVINLRWKGWRARWSLVNTARKNLLEKICIDGSLSSPREHIKPELIVVTSLATCAWALLVGQQSAPVIYYPSTLWGRTRGNFRKIMKPFSSLLKWISTNKTITNSTVFLDVVVVGWINCNISSISSISATYFYISKEKFLHPNPGISCF